MSATSDHLTAPTTPLDTGRGPVLVSLLWGNLAAVAAVVAVGLLALPFRPESSDGWAELGWFLITLAIAAVAGLLAGAVGIAVGLRRAGHDRAVATALVYLPVAALVASVSAGVGVLAAPALARWLVHGFTARSGAPVELGYGPPELRAAAVPSSHRGVAQRLAVTGVGCVLLTGFTLNQLGHRIGGQVHGEYLVWAACLPVLVVVPVLLLRGVLPVGVIAAAVALMAGLTALAVPSAVAGAHPSPQRLERLATGLPVPAGQRVVAEAHARVERSTGSDLLPVTVLLSAPVGQAAPVDGIPTALRPRADGSLPQGSGDAGLGTDAVTATAAGQAAADTWEQLLLDDGWEVDEFSVPSPYGDTTSGPYWLPQPAARLIGAQQRLRYSRGPWVRADVVPYGDGALVVVSTRP